MVPVVLGTTENGRSASFWCGEFLGSTSVCNGCLSEHVATPSGAPGNYISVYNSKTFCLKAIWVDPPLQLLEVVPGDRLYNCDCRYVAGDLKKALSMDLIVNLSYRPERICSIRSTGSLHIPSFAQSDSGCDVNQGAQDPEMCISLNKQDENLRRAESMTLVIYLSDCCCPEHPHVCRYTGKLNTACLVHPREESDGASPAQSVGTRRPECGDFAPEECRVCEVLVSEAPKNSSVTKSTSFHKRVRQHLSKFIKKGARLGMMCLPGLWG